MKKSIVFLVFITGLTLSSFAQSPESFTYQAVLRDSSANILANQTVGVQISVLQGSESGSVVYQETFSPTTNAFGLVNLNIGTGTVQSGTFAGINWANGSYFMEIAVDASGGTNYTTIGTSQLLSVPYALHASSTDNVDDADPDPSNEIQNLSLSNDTLSISNGNSVFLNSSGGGENEWAVNGDHIYNANSGNVGIGKTNPDVALDVLGKIHADSLLIPTGATDGYLLTSDTSGNATWQPLIDRTDWPSPFSNGTVSGEVLLGGDPEAVVVSGNYAYVANSDNDMLEIIDITDPAAPGLLTNVSIISCPHDVAVQGDYAYVVNICGDSFRIVDISDINNVAVVKEVDMNGYEPHYLAVSGNYAFVTSTASGMPALLKIIDISDVNNASVVKEVPLGTSLSYITVSGNYVYIARSFDNTLVIVDISDIPNAAVVKEVAISGTLSSMAASGNYVYLSSHSSKLHIVDVSDIANASVVKEVFLLPPSVGEARDVAVQGNYAYITYAEGISYKLVIVNISDPENAFVADDIDIGSDPAYPLSLSVAVSGNYAYVTNEATGGILQVVNLINDGNFAVVSGFDGNGNMVSTPLAWEVDPNENIISRYAGANVGIGTSPVNKLSVAGNADFTGNVGIGTDSPANMLSVMGDANFTGSVGVGTSSPAHKLEVSGGNIKSGGDLITNDIDGVINCGGSLNSVVNVIGDTNSPSFIIVDGDEDLWIEDELEVLGNAYKATGSAWSTISDRRLKRDIVPFADGLEQLIQIEPVWFQYNDNDLLSNVDKSKRHVSVIAQDIKEVAPYMVEEQALGRRERELEGGGTEVLKVRRKLLYL